jgi:glycosyltransferase involved in cell wall biosynthesis
VLRVVFVTNSLSGGGAERSMNLLTNGLRALNSGDIEVYLFPLTSSPEDLVNVECNLIEPIFLEKKSSLQILKGVLDFRKRIGEIAPDLVVLNCNLPELLGLFLPFDYPVVVVEHARHPWGNRKLMGFIVRVLLVLKKAHFVLVSDHLRVWPFKKSNIEVFPNLIIDTNVVTGPVECNKVDRLVFIGRLSALKRPDWFLEICKLTNIDGIVIGDGEMRESLTSCAQEFAPEIIFKGYQKDPWEFIREGDLLVVPSLSEGDGLVILEALKLRIPVILSNIVDFKRFNFPPDLLCDNPMDFARRILDVKIENNQIFLAEELILDIFQKRTNKEIVQKWLQYIYNLNSKI